MAGVAQSHESISIIKLLTEDLEWEWGFDNKDSIVCWAKDEFAPESNPSQHGRLPGPCGFDQPHHYATIGRWNRRRYRLCGTS